MTHFCEIAALVGLGCFAAGLWLWSPALSLSVCGGLLAVGGGVAAWVFASGGGSEDNDAA